MEMGRTGAVFYCTEPRLLADGQDLFMGDLLPLTHMSLGPMMMVVGSLELELQEPWIH